MTREHPAGAAAAGAPAAGAPDAGRRRPATAVTVLLVVVAVLVGAAVARVDAWWPVLTATTTHGEAGEVVTAGPVRVRVDGVRTGSVLADGGEMLTTGGVWVGVDLALSGTVDDAVPAVLELRDARGRDYAASTRAGNLLASVPHAADVPEGGTVLFELPAEALAGDLVLRVLTEVHDADVDRPQAVAEIALGSARPPAADVVLEPAEDALVPGGWDG